MLVVHRLVPCVLSPCSVRPVALFRASCRHRTSGRQPLRSLRCCSRSARCSPTRIRTTRWSRRSRRSCGRTSHGTTRRLVSGRRSMRCNQGKRALLSLEASAACSRDMRKLRHFLHHARAPLLPHKRSRSLILSHAHIYTRTHTPHATTPGLNQAKNTERRSFSTGVAHVIEQGDEGGGCFQKGRVWVATPAESRSLVTWVVLKASGGTPPQVKCRCAVVRSGYAQHPPHRGRAFVWLGFRPIQSEFPPAGRPVQDTPGSRTLVSP